MAQLFAGTSGFSYASWKPKFYPAGTPAKKFLDYYSQRLNSVEINYTFRRLPTEALLAGWAASVPEQFAFAVKANWRITHIARLKNAEEPTRQFLDSLSPLHEAKRLGPVLFQFPPQFQYDLERLKSFLPLLPRGQRFAFEFRHDSWFNGNVYQLLMRHNACLCLAESDRLRAPEVLTADFVYARLRMPKYTSEDLERIAATATEFLDSGRNVYVFFKHEETPAGALCAEKLLNAFGKE